MPMPSNEMIYHQRARKIMAKFLCCEKHELPTKLVVHHRDENAKNNDINNLQLMYVGDHSRLHCYGKGKMGIPCVGNVTVYKKMWRRQKREEIRSKVLAELNKLDF